MLEEGEDSEWWGRRASMIRTITKRPLRRVRIPRETAVYGREDELAKLRAFYDAAKSGDGCVSSVEKPTAFSFSIKRLVPPPIE